MRRLTASLAVIALLVVVPAAAAKEVSRAEICGAGGCATFSKKSAGPELQALAEGGDIVRPPAKGAPYFVVNVEIRGEGAHGRFTNHWVPSLNVIRGEQGTWMRMPASGKAALVGFTAYLEPMAASTLPLSASPESRAVARVTAPAPERSFPWEWAIVVAAAVALAALLLRRTGGRLARRSALRRA